MQSTGRSAIIMLAVLALSACSRNPAAPTPLPTPSPVTVTGDLSGTWTGEYAVTGCAPTQAPNQCTWYVPLGPETMTLMLAQSGSSLSGTFTSGIIGPLAVTGTVDTAGVVRLAGSRPSQFQCFQPSSIRANEVADWITEITKEGELRGTFRQSTEQVLSSCYTGRYDYFTQILSLRRQGRPPSAGLPPPPPAPDARTISGTIRDVRTNTPAARVAVTWHARGNDLAVLGSAGATTDAAGRFVVRLPNAGYYAVTFDHLPGHAAIVRDAAAADLFVMPEGCNWIRYGTIVDAATGRPIAGARISASGKSTVSGADGSYFLDWGCSNPAGARNTVVEHAVYASANQFAFEQDAVRGIARLDFALSAR